jgi:hypothetical protein
MDIRDIRKTSAEKRAEYTKRVNLHGHAFSKELFDNLPCNVNTSSVFWPIIGWILGFLIGIPVTKYVWLFVWHSIFG